MKNKFPLIVVFLILFPFSLFAFPQTERPIGGTKPLTFTGITTQATQMAVSPDNRYLVLALGSSVKIIDLASYDLSSSQMNAFPANVTGIAFVAGTNKLYILVANNKIYTTSLDALETDPPSFDLSSTLGSGSSTGNLISAKETGNPNLFFFDKTQKKVHIFDTSTNKITKSALLTDTNPTALVYVKFPSTFNTQKTVSQIFVSTDNGSIWELDESTFTPTQTVLLAGKNFPSLATDPSQDRLYLVNQTDNEIWILDSSSPAGGITKIKLDRKDPNDANSALVNTNLRSVFVTKVENPSETRVYVSGDNGLTIIRPTLFADPNSDLFEVLDLDGTADTVKGPLALSTPPGSLIGTSETDGQIFSSNSNGSISLISENPFVTIGSTTPAGPLTSSNSVFTFNFTMDETCNGAKYRVRVEGDLKESGGLLLPEVTLNGTEAQPIVTASIDINGTNRNLFKEGTNRIFVFLEDCDSINGNGFKNHVGRDSITVSVDRPPPDVTIQSVGFGNQKGIVKIDRLTESDISRYDVFVLPASNQINPTCPGGLDFSTATVYTTVSQPSSGSTVDLPASNLINGTYYCFAVQAVDQGGQKSPNRVVSSPILPEETVGITGASGENGCQLSPRQSSLSFRTVFFFFTPIFLLIVFRLFRSGRKTGSCLVWGLLLFTFLFSFPLQAEELSPKKYSLGFEGGFFVPQNKVLKDYLSDCCNGMYNFHFGRIFDSKYELNMGVGFLVASGKTKGSKTGRPSGESFNFFTLPISYNFVFRGQYLENQVIVPYAMVGLDTMYFRENVQGKVTDGLKFGYHAGAGVMILLEWFEKMNDALEQEWGINDTFFVLEGKWSQIDNFGGKGLKFNGFNISAGLLFEF